MKSKVYFTPVKKSEGISVVAEKLRTLLDKSRVLCFLQENHDVAVKMHFGEEGNTGFVKPEFARVVCKRIGEAGAKVFLADTNTLYSGRRTNSDSHLKLAREHGFTRQNSLADVMIPDDTKEENIIAVDINKKFIKKALVARVFIDADAIVGISHFKGHIMTGFGGALKNIGMGCATRKGKLAQHSDIAPIVYEDDCTGCGECEKACPAGAIRIVNNKSVIAGLKCIGCASCIAACSNKAIDVKWESGGSLIQEKMVEYAYAVLKNKRSAFVNFATHITKECDCLAKDDPLVAPDVGILASTDPVSIDKASFDLVNKACGKDIFRELHPERDGTKQLKYANELGLGNTGYELIEL